MVRLVIVQDALLETFYEFDFIATVRLRVWTERVDHDVGLFALRNIVFFRVADSALPHNFTIIFQFSPNAILLCQIPALKRVILPILHRSYLTRTG